MIDIVHIWGGLKTEVHTRYPGLGFQVQAALSAMGQCGGSHWGLGKAESDEVQWCSDRRNCWFSMVFPWYFHGKMGGSFHEKLLVFLEIPSGYDIASLPWKDPPPILKFGKPSISMGHLYHGYVKQPEGMSSTLRSKSRPYLFMFFESW